MGSRVARAVERAVEVLAKRDASSEHIEKTMWGSPAGKTRIASRLAAMLPEHSTYVEPFAGSGAVFFAKDPVATEALNDADPEIARAYKVLQRIGTKDVARLRDMDWVGDAGTFKKLVDATPKDDVAWLHKFLYTSHFAYGKLRGKSFSPSTQGVIAKTVDRIEKFAPRLKNAKLFSGDYKKVVQKFDGKDSVHFLDPPYAGYNVNVGEDVFDEHEFVKVIGDLKGKFLITYGIRGELPKLVKEAGYEVRRIRTRRSIRSMRGVGGSSVLTQLLISNYGITKKSVDGLRDEGFDVEDERPVAITVPEQLKTAAPEGTATKSPEAGVASTFTHAVKLVKQEGGDERFVLGIVLEPETVDAQGDIYSAEEIRQAAHKFMEDFRNRGLQHEELVNDQVKILETYLAPTDFSIGEQKVKKGTWLFAVRVQSDELWERVKEGGLTGFSIGGSARRVPEPSSSAEGQAA